MNISDYLAIIGIIVSIIGIIVGIIGGKSLYESTRVENRASNISGSTVQQAQIISNGLDMYAVIRLSKETTQQELKEIVVRIAESESKLSDVEKQLETKTTVHFGKDEPQDLKEGDIWFQEIE